MPRAQQTADDPLHDLDWLAAYIDKPKKTIYNWHTLGVGPPHYKIGNRLRYRKSEIDQWLRTMRVK
jgi:predicted DNA-binding transcriptional regulator AlpA